MGKDRGRIRGFYFEIDGSDDTLQEGLKNFGAALGRALAGSSKQQKALPKPKDQTADGEDVEVDETQDDFEGELVSDDPSTTKKKVARKSPAMPNVIEVNLEPDGQISFKDFIAKKDPKNFSNRFLCTAAWFKEHGGVEDVTADHIFTAYKIASWTPHPSSYHTTLSDLKNKQKTLAKGATPGSYKINLAGLNIVNKLGAEQ